MNNVTNVLVISDLHLPFTHKYALAHCKALKRKYKCNKVIFIGDLIDNAATSRWGVHPDGHSAGQELIEAIELLKPWYKAFPEAVVTTGNHCTRINKKLQANNVSAKWMKPYNEVLEVPNWKFVDSIIIDTVRYFHGEGCGNTLQGILQSDTSIVFGHFHTKFELIYNRDKFGMCIGWLGDDEAYAFEYAKFNIKKTKLGTAVVLNNGTLPILCPLHIEEYAN